MNIDWTDRELYWAASGQANVTMLWASFTQLRQELFSISHFMCRNSGLIEPDQLAEDCTQLALLRIWQKIHTCRQPETFRVWCKKIMRNTTLNEIKRVKRLAGHEISGKEDSDPASPEPPGFSPNVYETLLTFLGEAPLSDRSRTVIVGKYFLEQEDSAIAEELSRREGKTVESNHVQTTRSKNLDKVRSDSKQIAVLRERLNDGEGVFHGL